MYRSCTTGSTYSFNLDPGTQGTCTVGAARRPSPTWEFGRGSEGSAAMRERRDGNRLSFRPCTFLSPASTCVPPAPSVLYPALSGAEVPAGYLDDLRCPRRGPCSTTACTWPCLPAAGARHGADATGPALRPGPRTSRRRCSTGAGARISNLATRESPHPIAMGERHRHVSRRKLRAQLRETITARHHLAALQMRPGPRGTRPPPRWEVAGGAGQGSGSRARSLRRAPCIGAVP